MGFYLRHVFPRIVEWACGRQAIVELRAELLRPLRGEVLEIGFGTGLNLPHYPQAVTSLAILDPNPGMHALADARIRDSDIPIECHPLGGEALPYESRRFDAVVSTFTLCSIAKPEQALAEIRRVLRPGGRLYFLEHGLSPEAKVQRWQHRLTPLQKFLFDGCHLDRDIPALLQESGFKVGECRQFYLPKEPKSLAFLSQGWAEPS